MDSDVFHLGASLMVGVGLGIFYFGALWYTVRRLPDAQRPGLLALASFVGRTGVVVLGFYLLMDGYWERLVFGLLGFVLARSILVRRWRPVPVDEQR